MHSRSHCPTKIEVLLLEEHKSNNNVILVEEFGKKLTERKLDSVKTVYIWHININNIKSNHRFFNKPKDNLID